MQVENGPATDNETDTYEASIIRRILDGDVNAFETLLEKYQQHVFNVVARNVPYEEVADTAQEVFIRVYRSLPAYKATGSFKGWLTAIAVRTGFDYLRKRYRNKEIPISRLADNYAQTLESLMLETSEAEFESVARRKETQKLVDMALNKMSPAERMVVDLVYLQGLTGKEAAKILGWSVTNVKVRSYRCRKKLKKILSGLMEA